MGLQFWNSGPNEQFKTLISSVINNEYDVHYDLVYVLEADSVPQEAYWLETILNESAVSEPFAVFGSSYRGHNWNLFFDQLVIISSTALPCLRAIPHHTGARVDAPAPSATAR